MTQFEIIMNHINANTESKIVGSSIDESIVLTKVNNMNGEPVYTIKYELLELITSSFTSTKTKQEFEDELKELCKVTKFKMYDYYNKKDIVEDAEMLW